MAEDNLRKGVGVMDGATATGKRIRILGEGGDLAEEEAAVDGERAGDVGVGRFGKEIYGVWLVVALDGEFGGGGAEGCGDEDQEDGE